MEIKITEVEPGNWEWSLLISGEEVTSGAESSPAQAAIAAERFICQTYHDSWDVFS